MIKAVGFDLGDTLIEYKDVPLSWQDLYLDALRKVAEACEVELDDELLEEGRLILGKYNTRMNPREVEVKAEQILREILVMWNVDCGLYLELAINMFFDFFQRNSVTFKDTIDTLDYLKRKRLKIGILTDVPYGMDKPFVEKDISHFSSLVDYLLTSVEVGYRKPNAKGYEILAKELGVSPYEMIYVGNEEKDIVGGKAIGMVTVLVDRNKKGNFCDADYIINNLSELKNFIGN